MKLIKKYKDSIIEDSIQTGGYIYLNEKHTEQLLCDVKITTFDKLYIEIAIGVFDEGRLPQSESENIDYLRKYLEDDTNTHMPLKGYKNTIHPNAYFGYLSSLGYTHLITTYMHYVYRDIVEKYKDSIIYIDTDLILHNEDLDLDYLDIKYDTSLLKYLIMWRKKKYVAYPGDAPNLPINFKSKREDGLVMKGYSKRNIPEMEPFINTIKNEIRKYKIDSLIN